MDADPSRMHGTSIRFDPVLAQRAKVPHIILFLVGTMLLPAAALALFGAYMLGLGRHSSPEERATFLLAAGTASLGVLAWVALGLLFFKRASPVWQLVCWSVVALFGLCCVPSSAYWLWRSHGEDPMWLPAILITALIAGTGSAIQGILSIRWALRSIRQTTRDTAVVV